MVKSIIFRFLEPYKRDSRIWQAGRRTDGQIK